MLLLLIAIVFSLFCDVCSFHHVSKFQLYPSYIGAGHLVWYGFINIGYKLNLIGFTNYKLCHDWSILKLEIRGCIGSSCVGDMYWGLGFPDISQIYEVMQTINLLAYATDLDK